MTRARDLFDRLRRDGMAGLDRLIVEREPESLFLDFKRADVAGTPQLAPDDEKNLSRGISGFGNSEGGVLIFGVDCRADRFGEEVVTKAPLPRALAFQSKVESAISRATIPPHPGVETLLITGQNTGEHEAYVAVYVPKTSHGPLRSVRTNHYHLRSGSAFEIVGHDVLAGMFGRSPQPIVAINLITHHVRQDERAEKLVMSCTLVAINTGGIIAQQPCLSISYDPRNLMVDMQPLGGLQLQKGSLPVQSVIGGMSQVVAPGGALELCSIVLQLVNGAPREIRLDCTLTVQGAAPERFLIEATEDAVIEAIRVTREGEQLLWGAVFTLQQRA